MVIDLTVTVSLSDVQAAISLCRPHGGLKHAARVQGKVTATCGNGSVFYWGLV